VSDRGGAPPQPAAPAAVPLARLLALAYRALIDNLHERLRTRGWRDVRPSYGYVLLACRDGRPTSSEVAVTLGISKQAAAKLCDGMVEAGLLRRGASDADARAKPLRLTPRGRRLLAVVEEVYRELEGEWAAVIGQAEVDALRAGLGQVLRSTYGESLPPIRPV